MAATVRIAMWSGPRNISTAMMRSWDARPDTIVADEPFYAHYLHRTGHKHPGADEIMDSGEIDAMAVVERLLGPAPEARPIWYQKHMAHHLPPGMELAWVAGLRNCLLIRDPVRMLVSLTRVLPEVTIEETGLPQQVALRRTIIEQTGREPPVLDAGDVLADPAGTLRALCARLGVTYDECMLRWEPGPRPTDGVWARHWYDSVYRTTGFERRDEPPVRVPDRLHRIADEASALYESLRVHRLTPEPAH